MKNIYKNDKARALITGILTAFVSVSLAVLGAWNFDQSYFVLKLICFIFFTVLNILHLTFIVAQDSKDKKIAAELERQIKAFENASAGLIATCKSNATRINSLIHYVLSGKSIPEEVRKYKAVCYELCTIIYNVVRNLSNDDCEITYVKLNEAVPGEISTYAFKNQVDQLPKIFNKPRNYLNPEEVEYYDMRVFKNGMRETQTLYGSQEINNNFYRTYEERKEKPNKYNQFIAIPVWCDDKKMIGLLQIACFEKCSLGKNEEELKDIANRYLVPYANLFLLFHKVDKALHLA